MSLSRVTCTKQYLHGLMQDDIRRLKHFSISAIIFFVGYGMIYWHENNVPPSLEQELATLILLVVAGLAFVWAMTMQILYILSKILK